MNRTALVISGDGANGQFSAHVIKRLMDAGQTFDIISGVSVGALNGALIAQGRLDELIELWNRIERKDIYKGKLGAGSLWSLAPPWKRRLGIYDTSPLRKTIEKALSGGEIQPGVEFMTGAVEFGTGDYWPSHWVEVNETLTPWLVASASIPVAFPPTKIGDMHFLDGGVRNMSPLGDVLKFDPDHITVIKGSPGRIGPAKDPRHVIDVATRSLEILMNEVLHGDIDAFERINRLVIQAKQRGTTLTKPDGRPYKACGLTKIFAPRHLGDSLDFGVAAKRRRVEAAHEVADQILGRKAA